MPARQRKAAPLFKLTSTERLLLCLYRAVPPEARANVGEALLWEWKNSPATHKAGVKTRFARASKTLLRSVRLSAFENLKAGVR